MNYRWPGVLLFCLLVRADCQAGTWLDEGAISGNLPLQSWREMRDHGVQKQARDFSCGAAALATLLHSYYGLEADESSVLAGLATPDGATSFQELAEFARRRFGLQAQGYALDFTAMQALRVPVLVYLQFRDNDHFSVLRGIDAAGSVWLADPSWGNRLFTRVQFLDLWETRSDVRYAGKILVVLPAEGQPWPAETNREFFATRHLKIHIRRSDCRNCRVGLI
jgi:predicted double-glycine peptidase